MALAVSFSILLYAVSTQSDTLRFLQPTSER